MIKLCSLFLVIILIGQGFTQQNQYQVDSAHDLLEELEKETRLALKDLDVQWQENSRLLQQNIADLKAAVPVKQQECQSKSDLVKDTEKKLSDKIAFIQSIVDKIKSNTDRYNQIYIDRCSSNKNYISGLAVDKTTLGLIEFLRRAIQSVEQGSFLEQKEVIGQLLKFIQLYKDQDYSALFKFKSLLQIQNKASQDYKVDVDTSVEQRSVTDIGTQHIDQDRIALDLDEFKGTKERKTWPAYKQQLLQILDQLEEEIKQKLKTAQEDEIQAGILAAEFRFQLDQENSELKEGLKDEIAKKEELERELHEANKSSKQCSDELGLLQSSLQSTINDFIAQQGSYEQNRKQRLEELDVFATVRKIYIASVQTQGYQVPVEDVIGDGRVDGDYQNRKVDQIGYITQPK